MWPNEISRNTGGQHSTDWVYQKHYGWFLCDYSYGSEFAPEARLLYLAT
jgi:hypothetical protein